MPDDQGIVRYAIHPAIGIARIGNARPAADPQDELYFAPEIPGQPADPGPGGFKNQHGEIKREAARFRIYGYDKEGRAVREITVGDGVDIEWRVHCANRKAAWYKFHNAMDMKQYALPTTYRNAAITGEHRKRLAIDPGPQKVQGSEKGSKKHPLNGYVRFDPEGAPLPVHLGELRTDEDGRLIVLGGRGVSRSAFDQPAATFANNDGWYDDTSDGTVRATLRIGETTVEAEPAVVVVAPPNYGQGLYAVVTMYDVVYDLFLSRCWVEPPPALVFYEHIFPILERLCQHQWVNQGFDVLFGPGSPAHLLDPEMLARLADPAPEHKPLRRRIFKAFRPPLERWEEIPGSYVQLPPPRPADLPPFYGDGFGEYVGTALADLTVTRTQHAWLAEWAEGNFVPGKRLPRRSLREIPVGQQPATLDRAALDDCLGGPFHPGIELTWPLRVSTLWQEPAMPGRPVYEPAFRLRLLPENATPTDDYGSVLTPAAALGPQGPLTATGPGTLTRWLGIPWQTDEASCLSGYDTSTYLPLPSFWAARVPNQVLTREAFERVQDPELPHEQRLKHFAQRHFWLRDLKGDYKKRINKMVAQWHEIGIVTEQPAGGPPEPGLPPTCWVETGRSPKFSNYDPSWQQVLWAENASTPGSAVDARLLASPLAAVAEGVPAAEAAIAPERLELRQDQL